MRPTNPGARNPYSHVTFHKGFVHDLVSYKVLSIDQMEPKEKEIARGAIKTLASGPEAKQFVAQRHAAGDNKWAYTDLDNRGDSGVLRRCGIAVALFYKREYLEYTPGPGEPLPESPIYDPADIWQRLDIIGPSAKRANFFIKREVDTTREQNTLLNQQVSAKQMQIDGLETLLRKTEAQLENREKALTELRERVSNKRCGKCHAEMIKKKKQAEEAVVKAKAARMAAIAAREEKERQEEIAKKKAERLAKRREKLNAKRIAQGLPPKDYGAKKKKSKRGKANAKKATSGHKKKGAKAVRRRKNSAKVRPGKSNARKNPHARN